MKQILIFCFIAMGLSFTACQSNTKKETAKQETACTEDCTKCEKSTDVKTGSATTAAAGVYYFHGDRKCATCKVVGANAKKVAANLKVKFFDINFDQEENKDLAREFEASSSSLYIKSAKSGKIEDLTTFAFRNAINDTPSYIKKLQTVIKAELQ